MAVVRSHRQELGLFDDLLAFMAAHPAIMVAIVFGAASLEYVFPPFWGDTIMLAGCFMAGLDHVSPIVIFAAALSGSCVGATAAYGLGRRLGRASLGIIGRSERAKRLTARAERLYENHASRVLAVNRFLPGVRALFLPLAGIGNMPLRRVLVWSTVSNLLWCAMLLSVGLLVGTRTSEFAVLQGSFQTTAKACAMAAVGILLTLTVGHVVIRRRCSKPS